MIVSLYFNLLLLFKERYTRWHLFAFKVVRKILGININIFFILALQLHIHQFTGWISVLFEKSSFFMAFNIPWSKILLRKFTSPNSKNNGLMTKYIMLVKIPNILVKFSVLSPKIVMGMKISRIRNIKISE